MIESEWIAMFSEIHHLSAHRADADEFGGLLFSTDSFSETEDFFLRTPPEIIGRNMAAAACSDLLACGVRPQMLLQSWNIDETKGMDYYRAAAQGVEDVLRRHGAKCIGGDTGSAHPWQWTATVGGRPEYDAISRIAKAKIPFDLYISGPMGLANAAAFSGGAMPEISWNDPVPANALFATDSSGGFFDALENFRRVNPGMRLFFDVEKVLAPELSAGNPPPFDPVLALIGGVGEYELVYGIPRGSSAPGIRIGKGEFSGERETLFAWEHGRMKNPPPDYCAIPPEHWVSETIQYLKEMREA